jgi:hypothetical protein
VKYDPDVPTSEQRLIDQGWTIAYIVRERAYHSVKLDGDTDFPVRDLCNHNHRRRSTAWNCAASRANKGA